MKISKKLAILAMVVTTSLFADGLNNVSQLVNQINNASNAEVKSQLMERLNSELKTISKEELAQAKELVNSKLKKTKTLNN